jgi:hypothetical protein
MSGSIPEQTEIILLHMISHHVLGMASCERRLVMDPGDTWAKRNPQL